MEGNAPCLTGCGQCQGGRLLGLGCPFSSLEAPPVHVYAGRRRCQGGVFCPRWPEPPGLGDGSEALDCQQPASQAPQKAHLGTTVGSIEAKATQH